MAEDGCPGTPCRVLGRRWLLLHSPIASPVSSGTDSRLGHEAGTVVASHGAVLHRSGSVPMLQQGQQCPYLLGTGVPADVAGQEPWDPFCARPSAGCPLLLLLLGPGLCSRWDSPLPCLLSAKFGMKSPLRAKARDISGNGRGNLVAVGRRIWFSQVCSALQRRLKVMEREPALLPRVRASGAPLPLLCNKKTDLEFSVSTLESSSGYSWHP